MRQHVPTLPTLAEVIETFFDYDGMQCVKPQEIVFVLGSRRDDLYEEYDVFKIMCKSGSVFESAFTHNDCDVLTCLRFL